MTDNRTTELLCKLLEERGLSCQTDYLHVVWRVGPKLYDAVDNFDGTLTVDNLTPEQTIAATLGSDREAELTERNEYLESRHCEWSDPDSLGDGCMLRKDEYVDGLKAKIAELQARLDSEAQYAKEAWEIIPQWPRFEDGAMVMPGDEIIYGGKAVKVARVAFNGKSAIFEYAKDGKLCSTRGYTGGRRAVRPPILAKDGEPIEVGETLYGESDGMPWTVDRIDYGKHYSVMAHYGTKECGLKPEWLIHEQPDSWERIVEELRIGEIVFLSSGKANELADRIEKLAGEGA